MKYNPEIKVKFDKLVDETTELFKELSPGQRVLFRELVFEDYCEHCGWYVPQGQYCRCLSDE